MRRRRMRNKGFTLMEVLISIAVVGLLFAPMLTFFSHSAKLNVDAKKMQRENTVAQSVMEEVRSYDSIASMVSVYQDIANTDLKVSSGTAVDGSPVYSFTKNNIVSDGKTYNAKIKVDTSAYSTLNNKGMPVISSLGSGSTVMALEIDETLTALYNYQSNYHFATNGGNIDLDDLAKKMKKTLKVEITDVDEAGNAISEDMLRVRVYNEYSITGNVAGCDKPIKSAYLYNEEVVYKKLKGIYLFYNYDVYNTTTDIFQGIEVDVKYQNHPTWTCDYTLYAVCQKVFSVDNNQEFKDEGKNTAMTDYSKSYPVKTKITKTITIGGNDHSSNASYIPIFSNFKYAVKLGSGGSFQDGTTKTMDSIVKEEKIQRLSAVTVEIYEGSKKCTELTSTRGE